MIFLKLQHGIVVPLVNLRFQSYINSPSFGVVTECIYVLDNLDFSSHLITGALILPNQLLTNTNDATAATAFSRLIFELDTREAHCFELQGEDFLG